MALLLGAICGTAGAARVSSVSPQGETAQVRQVTVKFDRAVVPLGDLRQPDPFEVQCSGVVPPGAGRWANDRVWLYDFRAALPPGTRCTLKPRAGWTPLDGEALGGAGYAFSSGGPAVIEVQPGDGDDSIEEDQHFLLQLSGPATPQSVAANAWCEVDGIGERIGVRIADTALRDAVAKAQRIPKDVAARSLLVACARPLPADTAMRFVWGAGIAAAADPSVATRTPQRYAYRVRKSFSAEFSCERERAAAPCLPIRPLSLRFSAPIARAAAEAIRLRPAAGAPLAPAFDKDDRQPTLTEVAFPTPLAERAEFMLELPAGLVDDAGRPLANAALFPLRVATGEAPPIAKFAAAPFGVVEMEGDAMLPVTVRHVQGDLRPAAAGGAVRVQRIDGDAEILRWYGRLQQYHETSMTAREAGLPPSEWTDIERSTDDAGRTVERRVDRRVETRELSLLKDAAGAKRLALPQLEGGDPRPFEVVGLPFDTPGYHVVEIESQRLGAALLDKPAPLYVRTGVLVTNLGVHFKFGRENSLAWVTTLDRGQAVADAEVAVYDCSGRRLWAGRTDNDGLARIGQPLDAGQGEHCVADAGLFVTARHGGAHGPDMAFVFSGWQRGIEGWRFGLPTASGPDPDVRAHTVFDRTLLRAGETVSMKHFLRLETDAGLAAPGAARLPTRLKIVHLGSNQEFVQPLAWAGERSAASSWAIPRSARLGLYEVRLEREGSGNGPGRRAQSWVSGQFRVEAFRVPLVEARVAGPSALQVLPPSVPLSVQLGYASGGAMADAPLRVSALLKPRRLDFAEFPDFSFEPPRDPAAAEPGEDDAVGDDAARVVADKIEAKTDANGAATVDLKDLPPLVRASELQSEVSFNDPNGEVQTAQARTPLWPSAVVVGVRTGSWASQRGRVRFSAVVLDTAGRPLRDQAVAVRGRLTQVISSRKRMVGGFYAYDNRREVKDLGPLCSGRSDAHGLLACDAALDTAGQVELIAEARDAAGHAAQAAASVWVTGQGELWFAQENDDRIDLLPEKRRYEPGETARLQVRMPFRQALALVSVEREGVMSSRVVTLRGDDPTVELPIDAHWGPNVYVSVLALRGRLRDVPWYSLFTWGWRDPLDWARAFWYEGREYRAPTAFVDLAKPAFKLGVAALKVGLGEHELKVEVSADKPRYAVRQTATAHIRVTRGGQPAAGAEVAFAAVDEGLLALRPNDSWDLLNAMLRPRPWGVETSTAQSEIIGRRHYGRKAVAAGGGGGRAQTRELFYTLLLWQAKVALDANGEARVAVPLNDSLTAFRLVAIADDGSDRYGSGSTSIQVTQDLQLLSGLPPLVREGDRFGAMLTLRNTTAREMKLRASLRGLPARAAEAGAGAAPAALEFAPQELVLPPGGARELVWPAEVPPDTASITWEAAAEELGAAPSKASDRLRVMQAVGSAAPLRVLQATLQQLDGSASLPVAAPADALPAGAGPKRGGLAVALQPRLGGALPGLRRWFERYPYACLEQKVSKSLGLHDAAAWAALADALPTYLDSDGLAAYFPPRADEPPAGSDRLTAYVLAAAHEAGAALPAPARDAMLDGLAAFVEGRIRRRFWAPRDDLDVRKLAALEALSRYGRARPAMLASLRIAPNRWPTAALIDWMNLLRRVPGIAQQPERLDEAARLLRARLDYAGTTLRFSNEEGDFWWWLMDSADANAARLVLAALDDPAWSDDLPRLVAGSLGRQRDGAWMTTTANLWGVLALDKFAARFEAAPVAGSSSARLGEAAGAIDWARTPEGGRIELPWPARAATLQVEQQGSGKPWLTVQALAAIPASAPIRAGYSIERTLQAVQRKDPARWSRGDLLRVHLEIEAQADRTWVVVSDPVPAGATLLGSGLGRDSAIATRGERREGAAAPAFEERGFDAFRSYYAYLPRGRQVIEYTLRLNNPGRFVLPPTRVEAMYAPESFGELPIDVLEVAP